MAMKLEIIRKELIKPASPTPNNLRTIPLSFLDHSLPPVYVAAIFFYKAENHTTSQEIVSSKLKKSLSETLTRFYPLAGRIEGVSIICNDEGAIFTEARADCLMSDFLSNPDPDSLELFLHFDSTMFEEPPETWPLLHVTTNFFGCRGVAIAVCISHKICDAASFTIFVRGWTATAKGHADAVKPDIMAARFLLPADPSSHSNNDEKLVSWKCVTKRFVFDASKILELKGKASSKCVPNPTRVEAITSLIWKCAAEASPLRPSAVTQIMDLRRRIPSTHLPRNAIGNLLFEILLKEGMENEMEIPKIVTKLRKTKEEASEMIKENLQDKTLGKKIANRLATFISEAKLVKNLYSVTSWSRMGFYEVDFGWGSPVWVTPDVVSTNKSLTFVILMDAKDGEGIEAWARLPEQDMPAFEANKELLAFATPNPGVLI